MSRRGFTLVETMLVLLILALLAAGVSLSLSDNLRAARVDDAAEIVKSFDAAARQFAVASNQPVRIELDLTTGVLNRYDVDSRTPVVSVPLPSGLRLGEVKIGGASARGSAATIDVSPRGWTRTYAVRLTGKNADRWIVFAGLSGSATEVSDESDIPSPPKTPGYDAP